MLEMQQDQIARPRAAPHARQTRQTTMRVSQVQINQDVAVALTEVVGRLESLEKWRKEVDDERRDEDRRRESRSDQRIQIDRPTLAILIAALSPIVYPIVLFVASHWR